MLKFSPAQQAAILANRSEFNRRQRELQAKLGNSTALIGNAATLPKDVWGEWDREGIEIQREVLSVFNTLAASVSKPMPIGKILHYFQQISDSGSVNVSIDGRSKARTDQQTYDYVGTPIPIIDSTFSYGWREMAAAMSEGVSLDSAGRANAMYRVAKKLESITLDGDTGIVVNGMALYGLRTHPKRGTRTTGVALNGATGVEWLAEMKATLKKLHDKNYRAPATVFVNWSDWFYAGNTEFQTGYPKTIAQRVKEMEGIAEIIPASDVLASQIIVCVKNNRVLQVLNAMPMTTRAQFRANPEDDYNFVTMAAASLEIKYDKTDQCGVAVSSI